MSRYDFDNSNMYGHINTEVNNTELIDNVNNHSATTPHSRDDEESITYMDDYPLGDSVIYPMVDSDDYASDNNHYARLLHDYEIYQPYSEPPLTLGGDVDDSLDFDEPYDSWDAYDRYGVLFTKYRKYIGKIPHYGNYKPMNIPIRNIEHSKVPSLTLFKKKKTKIPKRKKKWDDEELRKLIQMLKQHQRDFNINDNFQPYKSTAEAYTLADRFRKYPYNIGLIE